MTAPVRRVVDVQIGYSDEAETEPMITLSAEVDEGTYAWIGRWVTHHQSDRACLRAGPSNRAAAAEGRARGEVMPSLPDIGGLVEETKRSVQQMQIAVASIQELAKNINGVVERLDRILTKFEGILK